MPSLMVDHCLLRTHTFVTFLACKLCHSLYMLLFNVDRYKISLCFKVPVAKCALKFFRKVTSASMYMIGQQMFPCKNFLALLTFVITNWAFFSSTMLGDHVIFIHSFVVTMPVMLFTVVFKVTLMLCPHMLLQTSFCSKVLFALLAHYRASKFMFYR